jgi:transposase InsO family protein
MMTGTSKVGRPRIKLELEALIVRLANENPGLGFEKLQGEFLKLGYDVGISTVRAVLERHHIPPAPERNRTHSNWRTFLSHYRRQMLACDFFTIETVFLKTIHVLFFIDIGTRRVYLAGCTRHPNSAWVTQQARQLTSQLQEQEGPMRFLIHDRDSIFSGDLDKALSDFGLKVLHTPIQSPKANAYCERLMGTIRRECLDHMIPFSEKHLGKILREWVAHYNRGRPHASLGPGIPELAQKPTVVRLRKQRHELPAVCRIRVKDILAGLHHEYSWESEAA